MLTPWGPEALSLSVLCLTWPSGMPPGLSGQVLSALPHTLPRLNVNHFVTKIHLSALRPRRARRKQ